MVAPQFKELASPMSGVVTPSGAPTISAVFEPYLTIYVDAQDRTLADMVGAYRRAGTSLPTAEPSGPTSPGDPDQQTVLPSSTELFYFYRQTLEQCATLSNRKPFRDLCSVFKKWLRIYANDVLRQGLVRSTDGSRRSMDAARPSVTDIQRWCLIMNTSDYCATTSTQLEEKLKEKMHPDYRQDFSLDPEREHFLGVISQAVQVLSRELEQAVEPAFNQMLRPPPGWGRDEQPEDKSPYVDDVASTLEQIAVVVRQDVENKRYVRMWSDKAVACVPHDSARFCRRADSTSFAFTQPLHQPLWPLHYQTQAHLAHGRASAASRYWRDENDAPRAPALRPGRVGRRRRFLVSPCHSPRLTCPSHFASCRYARFVGKAVSRIEQLLHVLEASDSPAQALIESYIEHIADRSMVRAAETRFYRC